ncbi:MAG: PPOX class F420-dependent oxidoreductase [Candidatus Lambdaproteobacteria bacterium]|nr:PPOX class F420-dependent oxidoreductase [Candidatus Lambdaproteobacteria bacterium]
MGSPTIPAQFRSLFTSKAFAHMATVMRDGTLQVTPVWVDLDGERVLINSALGRVKDRNLRTNPAVTVEVQDPGNPYRYISVRGRVVKFRQEGATEHIHKLAQRYMGVEKYPYLKPGMQRVIYEIEPLSVHTAG